MTLVSRARAVAKILVGAVPATSVKGASSAANTHKVVATPQRARGLECAAESDAMALRRAARRFVTTPKTPPTDLEARMRLGEKQIKRVLNDPRLKELLALVRLQMWELSPQRGVGGPDVGIRLGGSMIASEPKVYDGAPLVLYAPRVRTDWLGREVDASGDQYRSDRSVHAGRACLGFVDRSNESGEFVQPITRQQCADIDAALLARHLNALMDTAFSEGMLPRSVVGYLDAL